MRSIHATIRDAIDAELPAIEGELGRVVGLDDEDAGVRVRCESGAQPLATMSSIHADARLILTDA